MSSTPISVRSIIDWVSGETKAPYRMWLFERLLYLWFIGFAIFLLPIREILWGSESLFAVGQVKQGLIYNLFYVLNYSRNLDAFIFYIHLFSAICAFFGWFRFVPKVLVYLTGYMLYYAGFMTYNGGMIACLVMSFFMIFSTPGAPAGQRSVLTNLAFIAGVTQVLLIYSEAAATKWIGIDWREGSAIYYALHLEHYSSGWVRNAFGQAKGLLVFAAYSTLIYQTIFPFLIWFKKAKLPLLVIGIAFHLAIAIMLNLYDFGFALIAAYALFLDEKWAQKIASYAPQFLLPQRLRVARQ